MKLLIVLCLVGVAFGASMRGRRGPAPYPRRRSPMQRQAPMLPILGPGGINPMGNDEDPEILIALDTLPIDPAMVADNLIEILVEGGMSRESLPREIVTEAVSTLMRVIAEKLPGELQELIMDDTILGPPVMREIIGIVRSIIRLIKNTADLEAMGAGPDMGLVGEFIGMMSDMGPMGNIMGPIAQLISGGGPEVECRILKHKIAEDLIEMVEYMIYTGILPYDEDLGPDIELILEIFSGLVGDARPYLQRIVACAPDSEEKLMECLEGMGLDELEELASEVETLEEEIYIGEGEAPRRG